MKLLFLIADGMGGWPLPELSGRTTLEAAHTPHLDELAKTGLAGLCRTVPEGLPPGSDIANMSLLGFDPRVHHTGRGPIEAAAQGLALAPEDLVWRMNLVTLSELSLDGRMLDYSAGHIDTETAKALVQDMEEHLGGGEFAFHAGVQYRHLLVQKGGGESGEAGLKINPPHDITDKPIKPDLATFSKSAPLWDILHLAAERLARPGNTSRANAIWPWGQGKALTLPDFARTFGLRGAVISAVDLIRGLGRAAGMEVVEVPGATGLLDTDYEGKVAAAIGFLQHGDFALVHLEGPDECGHAGNIRDKIETIARFDARVVGPLRAALGPDVAILAACDHLTPIRVKTHVADPVPFVLAGPGVAASGLPGFSERLAASTGLSIDKGHGLLPWVLERLGAGSTTQ